MYYMQYIATAVAGLAIASTSMHVLWPSITIRRILSGNSPLTEDATANVSWIVMSLFLGTIPGAMISGWLLNKIGRKNCLLVMTAPLFLLWIPIGLGKSVWLLCIERCAAGIAISSLIIVVTVYNGEISDKSIRGRLGTTLNGFSVFGEVLISCIGPFVTYQELAIISGVLPLVATILIFFMPESPHYLIQIGKKEEAEVQLRRLMSNSSFKNNTNDTMSEIGSIVETDMENKSSFITIFTNPIYRKSLMIVFGIKMLQQLSGSSAFGEFTNSIIEASQSNISREEWKMILNAIPLIGVFVCGILVDKIGRKILLIISLVGCSFTLVLEGACCMILEYYKKDIHHISWLATGSLILYSVLRPLGIGTLPYVLMGELFATNIKHHAVAICGTANAVTGFILLKYFGRVTEVKALYITFWIFAGICILGSLFVHYVIPETKCKTFAEIQKDLNKVESSTPKPV